MVSCVHPVHALTYRAGETITVQVLLQTDDPKEMDSMEKKLIRKHSLWPRGLNMRIGGGGKPKAGRAKRLESRRKKEEKKREHRRRFTEAVLNEQTRKRKLKQIHRFIQTELERCKKEEQKCHGLYTSPFTSPFNLLCNFKG